MELIRTGSAPAPAGHYSQAVVHAGLVFVAGQLPLDPATGEVVGRGIEEQTERTLRNVEAILEAAGSSLERLLSVTVYVTGRALWAGCNEAFARVLGEHRPARAIVPVPELRHGCLVEIQAVAALRAQEVDTPA
jgi:2-iminobutanoate/2-iminopropanoate deaminase